MLVRTTSFALMTALALGAPAAIAAPDTKPVAAQVETTTAPKAAAQSDAADYQQREAKDAKVADYKGGSTVVIAMSGGAFVVLLFLLLLL